MVNFEAPDLDVDVDMAFGNAINPLLPVQQSPAVGACLVCSKEVTAGDNKHLWATGRGVGAGLAPNATGLGPWTQPRQVNVDSAPVSGACAKKARSSKEGVRCKGARDCRPNRRGRWPSGCVPHCQTMLCEWRRFSTHDLSTKRDKT